MSDKLVTALLDKYPDIASRTAAKLLRQMHPGAFKSLEVARSAVRHARGANGSYSRAQKAKDPEGHMTAWARELAAVEAAIPAETKVERAPHPIETGWRYLVICDGHIPEHSRKAIETALDYGKRQGCKGVIELGDMSECKDTSRFRDDPGVTIRNEIRDRTAFMGYARKAFPSGPYYSKIGNHEDNLRRYINAQAPALACLPGLRFEALVPFEAHGVEVVESTRVIKAGKMSLLHGHEYRGGGGVSPARWLALKAKTCAACGHFHATSSHASRRVDGFEIVTFSIGCLRSRDPEWSPLNDWNWGFAVLDLGKDGDFDFRNFRILSRGEVVPG